jgi:pimeloyl-ACP methyl ester carboxylesterase
MARSNKTVEWEDIYYTSRDGLRLHARHYPAPRSTRRPVLCLPGLTRNARDFHDIATHLADPRGHRRAVYAVDYRGRGQSEYDPDWKNYTPFVELLDVLDLMTIVGIHDAAVIGTSRGGLIAMIMATLRPTAIGALILNDIGPVIERRGLARIVGYVGRIPVPANWAEAAEFIRDMNQRDFPAITEEEWDTVARQWFNNDNGLPTTSYDKNLSKAISLMDGVLPELWPQFDALRHLPVLVLRGENSDILSQDTVDKMIVRHPRLQAHLVRAQGHAPLLMDAPTIDAISTFLINIDSQNDLDGATH